jgi:hypothetical protein
MFPLPSPAPSYHSYPRCAVISVSSASRRVPKVRQNPKTVQSLGQSYSVVRIRRTVDTSDSDSVHLFISLMSGSLGERMRIGLGPARGSRKMRAGALAATGALLAAAVAVTAQSGVFRETPVGAPGRPTVTGAASPRSDSPDATPRSGVYAFTVTPAKTATGHSAGLKTVGYLGHGFTVPDTWTVVDLSTHPSTCVRFDVHAVYIGTPGSQQDCPARGVGRRTGAMLIQPAFSARSAVTRSAAVEHPMSAEINATAPGVVITATYSPADQSAVLSALAAANLPRPTVAAVPVAPDAPAPSATPSPAASFGASPDTVASGTPTESSSPSAQTDTLTSATVSVAALRAGTTEIVTGNGFDACAAPSSSQMSAWAAPASPFTAVGIYIGGSERGCAQPNLTASWTGIEAAAGWHFMPLYVGWQAAWDSSTATPPATLGTQSADDAIAQAQSLGFGIGSVIYYDMEAYPASARSAAMSFLSSWSLELHLKGYRSAVYSSENSGIADLVAAIGTITEPDVVAVANWNGIADGDPAATPTGDWTHRRVHQYQGDVKATYGGVTDNIDRDYFDLDLITCGPPQVPGRQQPGPNDLPNYLCP